MSGDTTPYTNLLTSEYQNSPKFLEMVQVSTQGSADDQLISANMSGLFDLDTAVGDQLDILGQWIGISRYLSEPLTDVYFSFDTVGLGFDQGTWFGPFDPTTGLVALPDDAYRVLLYAKIANNKWDGSVPGAYQVLDLVFPGNTVFIQDNQDMSMYIGVVGPVPLNATTMALFTGGYLDVKPVGVRIAGYITSSVPGEPVFGFDVEGPAISGFDVGAWALFSEGN